MDREYESTRIDAQATMSRGFKDDHGINNQNCEDSLVVELVCSKNGDVDIELWSSTIYHGSLSTKSDSFVHR